jgi:hypothetical protein
MTAFESASGSAFAISIATATLTASDWSFEFVSVFAKQFAAETGSH